jgi:hypothetical protein
MLCTKVAVIKRGASFELYFPTMYAICFHIYGFLRPKGFSPLGLHAHLPHAAEKGCERLINNVPTAVECLKAQFFPTERSVQSHVPYYVFRPPFRSPPGGPTIRDDSSPACVACIYHVFGRAPIGRPDSQILPYFHDQVGDFHSFGETLDTECLQVVVCPLDFEFHRCFAAGQCRVGQGD